VWGGWRGVGGGGRARRARAEEIFGTPKDLWRRVLRRIGGGPGIWSTWTGHSEWN